MEKEHRVEFVALMAWLVMIGIIAYALQNYYVEDNSFLEATEENELYDPDMIQGMNDIFQGTVENTESTKVEVEYRYSIEYKDDTGNYSYDSPKK